MNSKTTKAKAPKLTRAVARKVLEVVDAGLVSGLGERVPGQMCVEAAVCYALDLPHGDDPGCVSPALRQLKITLNDAAWSSKEARAKGLRRLAIAQLGTAGTLDEIEFAKRVALFTINVIVPDALNAAASMKANANYADKLRTAAKECASAKKLDAASDAASYAARAAASAAASDARDAALTKFADGVVKILVAMKVAAVKWLDLCDAA